MKQISIDEARKAHENGLAVLLLGDSWNENDDISVDIGGELVLPSDDFTERLVGYDFLACGEHEKVRCFLLD
ncbi:MAG: hypothetical protein ACI4N8_08920 [Megasphaera sp.]|uniref:hypothetical protein n=1 Tax=Megasphaera sp. TaxID=2023260 RepID=UPI003F10F246